MSKSVRKYTDEFKQEAVNLALKSPSTSHAARQLGVPFVTLCGWVKKFKDNHASSTTHSSGVNNVLREKPEVKYVIVDENKSYFSIAWVQV